MSSTNVHSTNEDKHICGGQTIPETPDKSLKMPPEAAGRGPSVLEVMEGPHTEISVGNNIVVRDGNKIIGRATSDGQVLSGDGQQVRIVLEDRDEAR